MFNSFNSSISHLTLHSDRVIFFELISGMADILDTSGEACLDMAGVGARDEEIFHRITAKRDECRHYSRRCSRVPAHGAWP